VKILLGVLAGVPVGSYRCSDGGCPARVRLTMASHCRLGKYGPGRVRPLVLHSCPPPSAVASCCTPIPRDQGDCPGILAGPAPAEPCTTGSGELGQGWPLGAIAGDAVGALGQLASASAVRRVHRSAAMHTQARTCCRRVHVCGLDDPCAAVCRQPADKTPVAWRVVTVKRRTW
jgi:hypothetical protein